MSDLAIRVEQLGKQYRIGAAQKRHSTLRDAIGDWRLEIGNWIGRLARPTSNFQPPTSNSIIWALKDVSFEVKRGEVVGIIGRNGAGKSTLLKILSSITQPTEGRVTLNGRVGSLLEVGTGFHAELTGRENIFLNGAILGMGKREIEKKFDEIVAFAEVEKFIDTPVKHYSSGMYVRLAFAVAAHLEPEILIVDEVLAVGDAQFQKKCLGKMGDVAKEGRTVLFVSHNMAAVQSLCLRVIWLVDGILREDGQGRSVVSNYLQLSLSEKTKQIWNSMASAPGNDIIHLLFAQVEPDNIGGNGIFSMETSLRLRFGVINHLESATLNLSINLFNEEGVHVLNTFSEAMPCKVGKTVWEVLIPKNLFNVGSYSVDLMVVQDARQIIFKHPGVLAFSIVDTSGDKGYYGKLGGIIHPRLLWKYSAG
jgi:lipopolysaccharide transport system ATP-binding protein